MNVYREIKIKFVLHISTPCIQSHRYFQHDTIESNGSVTKVYHEAAFGDVRPGKTRTGLLSYRG